MFSIEGKDRESRRAIAYVFIDDDCFSADYNPEGKFWLLLRGEPGMSACYFGPTGPLREAVKETLAGKDVKVPMKEPATPVDRDQRNGEINEALKKNREPSREEAKPTAPGAATEGRSMPSIARDAP